jgi:hypothetical protein
VQEWLAHADPSFTLRTYVHLLDEGLGDADFLDELVGPEQLDMGDRSLAATTLPSPGPGACALASVIPATPRSR